MMRGTAGKRACFNLAATSYAHFPACQEKSSNIFTKKLNIFLLTFNKAFDTIRAMKINIKKLEAERKRLSLTKSEFSRCFGMCSSAYSKILDIESTTLKTLAKIAATLHLDPRDLLLR